MISPKADLQDQLSGYIRIIETVLKPKLDTAQKEGKIVRDEIINYEELVSCMKSAMAAAVAEEGNGGDSSIVLVNIGHNSIFCNATVKETNKIFVHVGFGFNVEFTPKEAHEFGKNRIEFLKATRLKNIQHEIKEIRDHIQSATIILDQLHGQMGNL
jgi:prefoldin alpha subunit